MKEKIVEELGKDIENKKRMSKEYVGEVNKRIFSNIIIAIVILLYLIILILGSKNIEANIFVVDLKVCSIIIAMLSILVFERSYKKSDGKLCIYGSEALIVAIFTLISVYIFQIIGELFTYIMCGAAIIVPIYYLIKSIGIYNKSKAEYINSQSDVKEIVKEELPETVQTKRRRKTLEEQMEEYNTLYKQNSEIQEENNHDKEYEENDDEDDIDYYMYSTTNIENDKNNNGKKHKIFDDDDEIDEFEDNEDNMNTDDDIFESNDEKEAMQDNDEDDYDDYVERKITKTNTVKAKKEKIPDIKEEPVQAPKKRGRKPKNQTNVTQEEVKKPKTTNKTNAGNKKTTSKAATSKSTTRKTSTTKKSEVNSEESKEVKPRKKRTTKKEKEES